MTRSKSLGCGSRGRVHTVKESLGSSCPHRLRKHTEPQTCRVESALRGVRPAPRLPQPCRVESAPCGVRPAPRLAPPARPRFCSAQTCEPEGTFLTQAITLTLSECRSFSWMYKCHNSEDFEDKEFDRILGIVTQGQVKF